MSCAYFVHCTTTSTAVSYDDSTAMCTAGLTPIWALQECGGISCVQLLTASHCCGYMRVLRPATSEFGGLPLEYDPVCFIRPCTHQCHVIPQTQGSWTPAPENANDNNGAVGDVCPTGYYCTAGSVAPRACLSGTYSPSTGNTNSSECLPCEPGLMCPNASTTNPTEPCPGGFYCPAGLTNSMRMARAAGACW